MWTWPSLYTAIGVCAVLYSAVGVDAALFTAVSVGADLIYCSYCGRCLIYFVWRRYRPFTMLWMSTLPFYAAVGVGAALLLLDMDQALYLAVCGNIDIYTTYRRGTAAIFLPPYILDASNPPFRPDAPPTSLTSPKWCRLVTKLRYRAG